MEMKMTNSKDCSKCRFGIKLITVKCKSKNSTCSKVCDECPYGEITSAKYICRVKGDKCQ